MSLIAEGFVMNEMNTPTRVGELIETIEEIYNIPTPRVGMLVYVKDEGRCYIIRSLKSDVVAGVEVSGAKVDGYELWDIKATEEEMLKRIQGKSEESNPYTDGFKFIGHFTSVDALSGALDNLKYNSSENGQNRGYFRFTYILSQAEVVNYLQGINKVTQVIRGNFTVEDGKIKYVDGFGVIVRSYAFNKGWSDWSIVIDSNTISNIENSIEDKVNSAIAGLVDTAPEDLDTLKEIADWIATHKEGAADMVANISKNATAIADEKTRAISAETTLDNKIQNINNSIATLNRTIINYNTRYNIASAVTKQQVIEDLLNKGTADKGCIVTYYAEDGWHTIQYKLNYYSPTQGVKESNWVEIGGGGESSYTLPVATADVLGGVKSSTNRGYIGESPAGREYALNVNGDGFASVTIPVGEEVDADSDNPVSGKAVADYVVDAVDTPVANQTDTTATIAPNVLNLWGEVTQLDITLGEGKDGVVNEYMFQFTSGATTTTLVLSADVKWLAAPSIQANKTYQVSIINNLGVIGEFSHE